MIASTSSSRPLSGIAARMARRMVSACSSSLVAAAAAEHGTTLATRDRRAAETYRALDIDFELIN